MLTSHSRCQGAPPKEPWGYSKAFLDDFRKSVELKYRLMPYIYTQAKLSSEQGFPMIQTLFFEYTEDSTAWYIEDAYMFGSDILAAPLMEEGTTARKVYLPEGRWIDYQTHQSYEREKWHYIEAKVIQCIILVKNGCIIPHKQLEQSTQDMNWKRIYLQIYSNQIKDIKAYICLPSENKLEEITLRFDNDKYGIDDDLFRGKVNWHFENV